MQSANRAGGGRRRPLGFEFECFAGGITLVRDECTWVPLDLRTLGSRRRSERFVTRGRAQVAGFGSVGRRSTNPGSINGTGAGNLESAGSLGATGGSRERARTMNRSGAEP